MKELAERLGTPEDELRKRAYAAHAKGWIRGFTGIGKRMGHGSVATLKQTGNETDSV